MWMLSVCTHVMSHTSSGYLVAICSELVSGMPWASHTSEIHVSLIATLAGYKYESPAATKTAVHTEVCAEVGKSHVWLWKIC